MKKNKGTVSNTAILKSTIIISVYKDTESLALILNALKLQTVKDFEIIVSEDGNSEEIKKYVEQQNIFNTIIHLCQKDKGFRKNRALNRAILMASSDHIILIDGDCVPHTNFIKAHQKIINKGIACTGRRVELGSDFSKNLRQGKIKLIELNSPIKYILNIIRLITDKTNDYTLGLPLSIIQPITVNRKIALLGCNLSFHKEDIYKINGFNEDYQMAGIGEDTDIEWRLRAIGITIKNVKFSAKLYHLYHKRAYSQSDVNLTILKETKLAHKFYCTNGINKR